MNLFLDLAQAQNYNSKSQTARVLTEYWLEKNVFCPSCNADQLIKFPNNKPVADFYCQGCSMEYELKSQKDKFLFKVVDGAYDTMVQRLASATAPSLFLLNYSTSAWKVQNLVVIPHHFLTLTAIQKRNPLGPSARRAGWTGCNIILNEVPAAGIIYLIKAGQVQDQDQVRSLWLKTKFLQNQDGETKGWVLEVMKIVDKLPRVFSLREVYAYELLLKERFPNNNNIRAKVRQQLQVLRDRQIIKFQGKGYYEKVL